MLGGTISLSPIFEPITDLRGGEAGAFRQFSLFDRARINDV